MIYFMRAGESGHVKIGWTKDHETLLSRRATLQTGQPHPLVVLRTIDDAPRQAEGWLHGFFAGVRAFGEWFEFQPDMLTIEPPSAPTEGWPGPSTRFICRMPNDLLARLRLAASERSMPMARIVFSAVERELAPSEPGMDELRAEKEVALSNTMWALGRAESLESERDTLQARVVKQAEEIADLQKALSAAQARPPLAVPLPSGRPTEFQRASEVRTNFQPRHKAAHAVLREDET